MSISPSQTPGYVPPTPAPAPSTPARGGLAVPLLAGAVVTLLATNVYFFIQMNNLRKDVGSVRDTMVAELTKVRETSSLSTATNRRTIDNLREELAAERRQARMAAGAARTDALKRVEETRQKLEQAQAQQQAAVKQELSEVKETATAATTKITEVGTEVSTVKSDVASTRSELEKTIADLKRTTGDLNIQSGLIATNGRELSALKALGERNYFEFNVRKSKEPQKVGDISIVLKRADAKRNRYTLEVIADDKRVEKKDKTLNEPLQFITSKARQPYEIVVNEVHKDQIAGYLATPKVQNVRN